MYTRRQKYILRVDRVQVLPVNLTRIEFWDVCDEVRTTNRQIVIMRRNILIINCTNFIHINLYTYIYIHIWVCINVCSIEYVMNRRVKWRSRKPIWFSIRSTARANGIPNNHYNGILARAHRSKFDIRRLVQASTHPLFLLEKIKKITFHKEVKIYAVCLVIIFFMFNKQLLPCLILFVFK